MICFHALKGHWTKGRSPSRPSKSDVSGRFCFHLRLLDGPDFYGLNAGYKYAIGGGEGLTDGAAAGGDLTFADHVIPLDDAAGLLDLWHLDRAPEPWFSRRYGRQNLIQMTAITGMCLTLPQVEGRAKRP